MTPLIRKNFVKKQKVFVEAMLNETLTPISDSTFNTESWEETAQASENFLISYEVLDAGKC